jgi:acyl-CoA reductase-like NAD-dependent aldehyde dehydrogenase
MATTAQRVFSSVNPATGEVAAEFPEMPPGEIEAKLARAQAAFERISSEQLAWRSERTLELAQLLRRERESLSRLITEEMGKPISEAEAEVDKCAISCEYFAHEAGRFLKVEEAPSDSPRSLVAFRPLGVVLAIMPWNYPLWQVIRFLAPALMAGNTGLLKHAPTTFGCALALEELVARAGFPEGSLAALVCGTEPVPGLIADRRVRAVTLTGSDVAGSRVAEVAGRELKKAVLELGGSDFFMVLADADLDQAAEVGVRARFQNGGQSCIAAKRFLLQEPIVEAFLERFLARCRELTVGDPLDRTTRLGPLARADLRDRIHQQVESSRELGARVLLGGEPVTGPGFFYPPTVLTEVTPEMVAFEEETFGPVAAVSTFRDLEEGIRLANHPRYGLGGNLWTKDPDRGVELAGRFDTGGVFVNGMTHSDARIPFGGVRRSGFGRELASFGIREFTNIQTVWRP